ncbi:MAG: site-2 protease family protein [Betaproteobacteria bacterium]|nr:site-2 protease family protein [Betaproteobacteria bacterium]
MDVSQLIEVIAIYAIPVLFAITIHEAAHGYVARYFGDMTAFAQGRISLNPIRHIDPVGTILVPGLILAASAVMGSSGILFGWAKPVPVNYSALRRPKRDMLWVAAAGPFANLAMAMGWAMVLKIADWMPENEYSSPMKLMSTAGVTVNVVLMVLNLLPILPLDGGRIIASLLPIRAAWQYAKLEPWGFPILLILLFTNVLGVVLAPMVRASFHLIGAVFQL